MEATLDADTARLKGVEKLVWRNTSSAEVKDLWFHHYLNAFSSNRTTFMEESGGRLRRDSFDSERWGWIEVSSLRLEDGTDLKGVEEYLSPDDGNPFDRTVARYPLPQPLAPGEEIEVVIEFESQLPSVFARTGMNGDYILAGQWFPKIAVFEDKGLRGRPQAGWNCHQFHAHSEFYADFGDYDVTLRLPERFAGKIGATGELVEETREGEEVVVRFVQPGVHDFAWTAHPKYQVVEDLFDPVADVPAELTTKIATWLGVPEKELELTPVKLTLLLQPQRASQASAYLESAKAALRGLGLRLGAYPYSTLTIVDPAYGSEGSGGMEYPTFITGGTSSVMTLPVFRSLPVPEMVTVHEFAHQYFQGMIASNEFEESWIDEGITSFYEGQVMAETYGPINLLGAEMDFRDFGRQGPLSGPPDPIVTPAWGFYNGRSYGASSYSRPALVLRHLEATLGPQVFHRAMRAFFQRYQFSHPSTADFERTFSEAVGRDLSSFFSQALHSTRALDFSIRSATSREVKAPQGVFWEGGERFEVEKPKKKKKSGLDKVYETTVMAFREGGFRHPVTLEMEFENGERQRKVWNGEKRWHRWTVTGPSKLRSARVDPEGKLVLDANRLNNGLLIDKQKGPVTKLLVNILFWTQNLIQAVGLFS